MNQPLAVFMVGPTHSGKTTHARQLHQHIPRSVMIDRDEIILFCKQQYSELYSADHERGKTTPGYNNISHQIYHQIAVAAMTNQFHVIFSNSQTRREHRMRNIQQAREYGYLTAVIHFALPEEAILERIRVSERPTTILSCSPDFEAMYYKMRDQIEVPTANESDHLFVIIKADQLQACTEELITLTH